MKKFIFVIFTLILICLLILLYQWGLNKKEENIDINQTKENLDEIQNTYEHVSGTLSDLKNIGELSNLLKQDKQEIVLNELDDKYVYENIEFKFGINLDKNIFFKDKEKSFFFQDEDNLILIFMGKYIESNVNLAVLANNEINDCKKNNFKEVVVNDNTFLCDEPISNNQEGEYGINCVIIKNDLCFDFEYILSNISDKIPDDILIENILFKNIYFK